MPDNNPFEVFSDDEDDDDDQDSDQQAAETESSQKAKALIEKANSKTTPTAVTQFNDGTKGQIESETVDLSCLCPLHLVWPAPLYLGPMMLVSSLPVGGGRGYVASKRLGPGTLVLVEEMIMEWPPEQLGRELGLISVKRIFEQRHPNETVHSMEDFHPTIRDVTMNNDSEENAEQISKMMKYLMSEYQGSLQVPELVELAKTKGITNSNGSSIEAIDIIRLLLALRYNGLESGVYWHVAMLNHACRPNCVKLMPEGQQKHSEVRTTRTVEAEESLTISYLPRVMSHAARRRYLWDQHRFDIGADLKGADLEMELVGNSLPQSRIERWDGDSITHRIEKATEDLEKMLVDVQEDMHEGSVPPDTWETLKAMEQASLELYHESIHQLKNSSHILFIPILLVHMETCESLRKAPGLPTSIRLGITSRQVLTGYRLVPLQKSHLGPDHFDLARTNLDIANGVAEMLTRSPKKLFDLNLPALTKFVQWSTFEHKCRQEHDRVKELYPHDAESKMQEFRSRS